MVSSGSIMNSGSVLCRNPPGTKNEDFFSWPVQKFDEMDSTLAVQQYIQQTIRQDFRDIDNILTAPTGQDEGVWKYEHLRQFCMELNCLAVRLLTDCTPESCSQMTATEQWIFLCAAHKSPKECPAIDYTRHTLDGAAVLLNSNKHFPSRVNIKDSSVAKLGSVCRRVYRIFSHAYYHHRQIFDEAENETYLCRRFTTFVIKYNLMSRDNLIVPILSESVEEMDSRLEESKTNIGVSIVKKPSNTSTGIMSFLDLPEGVLPDLEESEDKYDVSFPDVLDDDASLEVDGEFSYADDATYATLKPGKGEVHFPTSTDLADQQEATGTTEEEMEHENTVVKPDEDQEEETRKDAADEDEAATRKDAADEDEAALK